jgi:hypothetical protein
VQCLYCETELRPFRGLFDEDFCCRDHRDKYFASFRKALNRLPALDFPPAPAVESVSLAVRQTQAPVSSADLSKVPDASDDLPQTQVLAAAGELADQQVTPPVEISAETVDLPLLLATYTAGEPAAVSSAADSEETPFGPPAADFLPVAVVAVAGAQTLCSTSLNALPVSYAIEFPTGQMTWAALIEMEQRPAELLDPPETAAATPFVPMPAPFELSAHSPAITQTAAMLPEGALPGASESASNAQSLGACGYTSPWNYANPLTPAPAALALASFCPAADGAAWLPTAEFAELTLTCQPLASSPVAATHMQLAHAFCPPVFTPSRETMRGEEERDEAHAEMPAGDSPAPAEIAPALVMNSAPVDRPALLPTCAAEMMPPALALSSARSSAPAPLSAPGLASTLAGQPNLAPELMADIPQAPAANQAAEPHAHAPLRPWFGSSVRIKNWRLRITFAKPA